MCLRLSISLSVSKPGPQLADLMAQLLDLALAVGGQGILPAPDAVTVRATSGTG
jgi:hypothetical protein